jgi:hypothetical protein
MSKNNRYPYHNAMPVPNEGLYNLRKISSFFCIFIVRITSQRLKKQKP